MDIWIIRDGEKSGPIHDFEVRRQIQAGELQATTAAWHEGQAEWKPLGEIELFKREFEPRPAASTRPSVIDDFPQPPPLPQPTRFGRRFWARWFDLSLYSGFWWLGMWAANQNLEAAMANPWIMFLRYIPWFVFETLLLHYWGSTPGKWLLGMSVTNLDGSRLDLGPATRRSGSVLFTGIGFGFSLLSIFCQVLSLVTARRLGTTLWDHIGGHRVNALALSPSRVTVFVCLYLATMALHFAVFYPYMMKAAIEQNPEFKRMIEQHPSLQPPAIPPKA